MVITPDAVVRARPRGPVRRRAGRSVTVRRVPRSRHPLAVGRLGDRARRRPRRSVLRRSRACWSVLFAHLLMLRRSRLFSRHALKPTAVAGLLRAARCREGVSGSASPTGIACSPRRTTTAGEGRPPSRRPSSGLDGRPAEERGPQHPARAVDADDPRRLLGGAARRRVCTVSWQTQLGAEAALALGGGAAAPGHVGGDLGPDLAPQVAVARGGEGAQLDGAVGAGEQHRLHGLRSPRRPGAAARGSARG